MIEGRANTIQGDVHNITEEDYLSLFTSCKSESEIFRSGFFVYDLS